MVCQNLKSDKKIDRSQSPNHKAISLLMGIIENGKGK